MYYTMWYLEASVSVHDSDSDRLRSSALINEFEIAESTVIIMNSELCLPIF